MPSKKLARVTLRAFESWKRKKSKMCQRSREEMNFEKF